MAYDYVRDRFSVEANDSVPQDEQVQYNNTAMSQLGSAAWCSNFSAAHQHTMTRL